ncbi:hypothetical protein XPA_000697 [Xanthoria parietina]
MLCPTETLLVLIITSLTLRIDAFPVPNTKSLLPRSEIPNEACKRSLPSHNGAIIPRNRACGGGGGGGGDFYDGSQGNNNIEPPSSGHENIDIPTIEIHGTLDTTARPTSSGFDPPLVAVNENKGLSWPCAMHAALAGWEAGLACSLLEEKYGPGSVAKPPPPSAAPAPPKSPAPPPPAPKPPTPKQPAPAPSPKKSDGGGGWRGVGPVRAVPRGLLSMWKSGNV